ncbi:DUF4959 domain-containing protein [Chitinophaga rhizosphaerae]|uniref:DUF4959 domain-containing protein n=1 Tax=Chitinophaga rhizosphaerae TaxID=1864947 RepID=UPI000F80C19E|nr:DUF4959 domain-containing protein [Chitinophaga rhizosphaerae]
MKKSFQYISYSLLFVAGMVFSGCQKQTGTDREPIYKDGKKPLPVKNVRVQNFPGGATIIYDIPAEQGILYVQADFKINSTASQQVKSSFYTDTIVVRGFEREGDYKVMLSCVNRSEVKSDPVEVTVHPGIPPYQSVKASLKVYGDFGGANIAFENPTGGEIAIISLVDTIGKGEYVYTHYTKNTAGNFSVRGFRSGDRKYGACVRDRWGNTSDTVWETVRSMNEVELDRTIMQALVLPGDQTACCGSDLNVPLRNPYQAGDYSFYGVRNPGDSTPPRITVDMGKPVVLSRFRYYMRKNGGAEFKNGTLRFFKIYGSMNPNPSGAIDGSWTQIGGVYELVKPSGLPYGQQNAADHEVIDSGSEFTMPLPAVPMRYFRLMLIETFSGGLGMEISSLKFMGDYL